MNLINWSNREWFEFPIYQKKKKKWYYLLPIELNWSGICILICKWDTKAYLISIFSPGRLLEFKLWNRGFSSSSASDSYSSPFHIRCFGLRSTASSACIQPNPPMRLMYNKGKIRQWKIYVYRAVWQTSSGTWVIGGVVWNCTLGAFGNLDSCSSSMFLEKFKEVDIHVDLQLHNSPT